MIPNTLYMYVNFRPQCCCCCFCCRCSYIFHVEMVFTNMFAICLFVCSKIFTLFQYESSGKVHLDHSTDGLQGCQDKHFELCNQQFGARSQSTYRLTSMVPYWWQNIYIIATSTVKLKVLQFIQVKDRH